ncbi:MAG TPA: hypothetical protein DIW81_07400 [Planctomycetaceae bacterium]|nr:hypothetical protein [Planctomycetaceae bacterium]
MACSLYQSNQPSLNCYVRFIGKRTTIDHLPPDSEIGFEKLKFSIRHDLLVSRRACQDFKSCKFYDYISENGKTVCDSRMNLVNI